MRSGYVRAKLHGVYVITPSKVAPNCLYRFSSLAFYSFPIPKLETLARVFSLSLDRFVISSLSYGVVIYLRWTLADGSGTGEDIALEFFKRLLHCFTDCCSHFNSTAVPFTRRGYS